MPVILDTNVVSEMIRPRIDPNVDRWLSEQDESELFLTTITEAELLFGPSGMPQGPIRDAYIAAMDRILFVDFSDRILPFDRSAANSYPRIRAAREAIGRRIDDADCFIAAIAESVGASVATRNVRDFVGCGVEVINPWEYSP